MEHVSTVMQRVVGRLAPLDPDVSVRFMAKVSPEPNTGCWLWTGQTNYRGYGLLWVGGAMVRAHRVSYAIHIGSIPDGLEVCHRCDQPSCVNPRHLYAGTHIQNMRDMDTRGRRARLKGEAHPAARLTEEQVLAIRARYAEGGISCATLAKEYGRHTTAVQFAVSRRTWRHLP